MLRVSRGELLHDRCSRGGSHEHDGAAAEASTGHASAERTALLADAVGDLHDSVELRGAHLEIASERLVTQVHEASHLAPVSRGDRLRRLQRAGDFGHYVPGPLEAERIEPRR